MSAETTGIPLVVRYNSRGQPDGLKEELNIIVNSVSANEYKGGNIGGPGVTYFSALSDTPDTYDPPGNAGSIIVLTPTQPKPIGYSPYGQQDLENVVGLYNAVTGVSDSDLLIRSGGNVGSIPQLDFLKKEESIDKISDVETGLTNNVNEIVYINSSNKLDTTAINPGNIVTTTTTRNLNDPIFTLGGQNLSDVTATPSGLPYFNGTKWTTIERSTLTTGAGGVTFFSALEDTAVTYGGNAGKFIILNPGEDDLIFSNFTAGQLVQVSSDVYTISGDLDNLETSVGDLALSAGLGDVNVTGPITPNPAYLKWDPDSSKWIPAGLTLTQSQVVDLNDVDDDLFDVNDGKLLVVQSSSVSASQYTLTTIFNIETNISDLVTDVGEVSSNLNSINAITLGLAANTVYVGTLGETQFSLENLTDTNTAEATTNYVLIYREGKWVSVLFDGLTQNKVNEGAPPPGGDPGFDPSAVFVRIHVSGLTSSGLSQGDVFKVGPSGTVISSPTYVAPLEGEDGKIQVVNPSNTAIINASGLIWDYLSEGLLVIGDVSAQNYYGNLSFATGEISNLSGVSSIQFETNMPPEYVAVEGEVYYDTDAHTLSIQTGTDTTLQVGQEQVIRVRNDSGEDIQNGSVVYVSGTQGTGVAKLLIGKASAAVAEEEQDIIGIATETILDGHDGFITTFGIVRGINTLGTTVGDIIYLSTSAGLFTSAAPEYPNHSIRLGVVLRVHESEGAVFAKIDPGYDIGNLHDVSINGIQTGESLYWDGDRFIASALTHGDLSGLTDDDHTQYITTSPLTSSRNVIQPASTSVGLTLQQPVIHTQPLLALKNSIGIYSLTIDGDGNIETTGRLTAESKSFLIDHPTKEGKKLQYTCLEGPENGVYCRGRVKTDIIELPDYWVGLVDEDTITVNLTPVGKAQTSLFVSEIKQNKIYLSSTESIDCFYTIYGERKDIEKLIVEF